MALGLVTQQRQQIDHAGGVRQLALALCGERDRARRRAR